MWILGSNIHTCNTYSTDKLEHQKPGENKSGCYVALYFFSKPEYYIGYWVFGARNGQKTGNIICSATVKSVASLDTASAEPEIS